MKNNLSALLIMHQARKFAEDDGGMEHIGAAGGGPV
jgi:hypothetical protein